MTVSVPVTVKFLITTSLKRVVPVALVKLIPPSLDLIGTSPIKRVLEETFKSLKNPLCQYREGEPKFKLPLDEGKIDPEIVPPSFPNLYSCSSPVALLKTPVAVFNVEILAVLVFILASRLFPVSIRLFLLRSTSNPTPVLSNHRVSPVVCRLPLRTPLSVSR